MPASTLANEPIFKVLTQERWDASSAGEVVQPMPVDVADGYMHFSTREQLPGTLRRHFAGQRDLLLLAVDPGRLGTGLVWEPARGGALFPHLYAPCPMAAVLGRFPLDISPGGDFVLPEAV